jgi:hypothetical protein
VQLPAYVETLAHVRFDTVTHEESHEVGSDEENDEASTAEEEESNATSSSTTTTTTTTPETPLS